MERPEESKDYYRVLEVSPSDDREVIGRAYRRLMKAVHPDARRGRSDPNTGRRVAELVEAWRVLGDPLKRSVYDRGLLSGEAGLDDGRGYSSDDREPVLEVRPRALDLGVVECGETPSGEIRLHSTGGPAKTVERLNGIPTWLSVHRSEPTRPAASFPKTISVRVDSRTLLPRRRYRTELVFRLVGASPELRSPEKRVPISLMVVPKHPPILKARPAGWVVSPCQCQGAPRSLLLHLFLTNSGGGSVKGSIQGDSWMRFTPGHFGPLRGGDPSLHISVELDCERWAASAWRDGSVTVATEEGDLLEIAVIAGESLAGTDDSSVSSRLNRLSIAAAMAVVPSVALLTGLWQLALVAVLVAGLAAPRSLRRLYREHSMSVGLDSETTGWQVGPKPGGFRPWLLLLIWATLGALLAAASERETVSGLPGWTLVWAGAISGAIALMSVVARDRQLPGNLRRADSAGPLWASGLAVVVGGTWTLLGALVAHGVAGSDGTPVGAALGWLTGSCIVLARSPGLRTAERQALAGLLWGVVPVISGLVGFAVVLPMAIDWGLGLRAFLDLLLGGRTGISPLLVLPAASLASFVIAVVAGIGLVLGFFLGMATVLPVIDVAMPVSGSRSSGLRWMEAFVEDALCRHAGIDDLSGLTAEGGEHHSLFGWVLKLHWSTQLVGAGAALLLIYAVAHLLLAVAAAVGVIIG